MAYFNRLQSLGERSAAVEFAKYKWESVTKRDYYTMNEDDGIPILAPAMKRSRNNQPDVHYYTDAEAKRCKGQNGSRILLDDESNGLGRRQQQPSIPYLCQSSPVKSGNNEFANSKDVQVTRTIRYVSSPSSTMNERRIVNYNDNRHSGNSANAIYNYRIRSSSPSTSLALEVGTVKSLGRSSDNSLNGISNEKRRLNDPSGFATVQHQSNQTQPRENNFDLRVKLSASKPETVESTNRKRERSLVAEFNDDEHPHSSNNLNATKKLKLDTAAANSSRPSRSQIFREHRPSVRSVVAVVQPKTPSLMSLQLRNPYQTPSSLVAIDSIHAVKSRYHPADNDHPKTKNNTQRVVVAEVDDDVLQMDAGADLGSDFDLEILYRWSGLHYVNERTIILSS